MPCDQHGIPLGNNASSFGNVGDWYLMRAILLAPILNSMGQGFVPSWLVIGQRFEGSLALEIEGVGAAILPEILNLVLRAELRLDDCAMGIASRTRTSSRSAAALQQV